MQPDRRVFLATAASMARLLGASGGTNLMDETLRSGIAKRKIPAVVGMIAGRNKTLYTGAFGTRDTSGVPVRADSIFAIASMTKAITTVAALQLVEEGKVDLDGPVRKHLPALSNLEVLEGFDSNGKPSLRPVRTPVTLRHLITHTSGFCYERWDADMFRYSSLPAGSTKDKPGPLMFEPGTRWQYGQGVDWAGWLVEAVSGLTLEAYFQQRIFQPLGMEDTSFILPSTKFDRLVSRHHREPNGDLVQNERTMPTPPKSYNGGGGLYSTASDYVRFMQMILNHGMGPKKVQILKAKTVEAMGKNQIADLTAGKMKTFDPATSSEVDIQPGHTEKWGLGFLINTTAYDGGRSAGSLAWAGLLNTFYWIDPKRERCGVILMQFLPFVDTEAVGLFGDFERASYSAL